MIHWVVRQGQISLLIPFCFFKKSNTKVMICLLKSEFHEYSEYNHVFVIYEDSFVLDDHILGYSQISHMFSMFLLLETVFTESLHTTTSTLFLNMPPPPLIACKYILGCNWMWLPYVKGFSFSFWASLK